MVVTLETIAATVLAAFGIRPVANSSNHSGNIERMIGSRVCSQAKLTVISRISSYL